MIRPLTSGETRICRKGRMFPLRSSKISLLAAGGPAAPLAADDLPVASSAGAVPAFDCITCIVSQTPIPSNARAISQPALRKLELPGTFETGSFNECTRWLSESLSAATGACLGFVGIAVEVAVELLTKHSSRRQIRNLC